MFRKTAQNNQLKNWLENLLIQKRGYLYALPKNQNVILAMSGGIDSSVGAQLLIEEWNSTIYPFYLKRGATAEKYEILATQKVVRYLKQKYPNNVMNLLIASAAIPLKEIKSNLSRDRIIHRGHPLRNPIIQSYAVQYGASLNDQGIKLNTVLVGSVASDYFPGSRDIDLLINTLYTCINMEEWDWQILSPFFQSGLLDNKKGIRKIDLIKWGAKHNFPFNLTRTCTSSSAIPCGQCPECRERIETFKKAKIKDLIKYKHDNIY